MLLISLIIAGSCRAQGQIWKKILPFSDNPKNDDRIIHSPIADDQLQLFIKEDCKNLSSPQMKSRPMGSKGAEVAGMYIGKTMNGFGVIPYAGNFIHTFWFVSGKDFTPETRFTIGKNYIFIPEEAFPAPYSATGESRNYILPDSRELGQPWIVPLYESQQEANDPGFDWVAATYERAQLAAQRGASALIFYDSYDSKYAPEYVRNASFPELNIPVVIIKHKAYLEKIKPISVLTPFYLNIKFKNEHAKAANIVGYIDNRAVENVLICAHYEGSVSGSEAAVNNNTSGVAAMMSLARLLVKGDAKKYNYILAAFSGGTSGQLGPAAFLQDKSFDKTKVAYVINLNNVGDFNRNNNLYVNGLTSSQAWIPFFRKQVKGFQYHFEDQGVILSDNIPFLKQGIPALSFATHVEAAVSGEKKVDFHSLNARGISNIVDLVYQLIMTMNQQGIPVFATTAQKERISAELTQVNLPKAPERAASEISIDSNKPGQFSTKVQRTSVGIVCDSAYNGFGVRVLDILKQQPAERAGLKAGDIIMQMGTQKINALSDYIAVVNTLKPGGKVVIKVKRGVTVQKFTLVNL